MTPETGDAVLARALAEDAGQILLETRAAAARESAGGLDVRALRDAADASAHRVIAERLAVERPDDVLFSEEAPDPIRRLAASRVWIVDPLDGTREFGEPGRTDWAVHVALWERGVLAAAAVALPARGEVVGADDVPRRPRSATTAPRLVVSRSRPPAVAHLLATELGGEVVLMGSAGAKAAAVWRGDVDAYVHTGGLHEWDAAAPVGVALAAGLHVSRLDGTPLAFNRPDPYVPDLLICTPELAAPVLARTAAAATEVIHR